jgi:hypothetical protein
VAAEHVQIAGLGLRLARERGRGVFVGEFAIALELVEESVEVVLLVAGAVEAVELLEEFGQGLGVVAGLIASAVVDEQDPLCVLVVDVDEPAPTSGRSRSSTRPAEKPARMARRIVRSSSRRAGRLSPSI